MTRTYQVEYFDRTTETDVLIPYDNRKSAAHAFARRMSDKHDGSAYVVSIDGEDAVGHVVYTFGSVSSREGDAA